MPLHRQTPLLGSLLAVGFAVLLTVSVSSIWLVRESIAVSDRVSDSQTIGTLYATLRAELRRAESGQRGYLLVGAERYLRDYEEAQGKIRPVADQLAEMMQDAPRRRAWIEAIRPLVEAKLQQMAQVVTAARAGERELALALVLTDRGLSLMQDILKGVTAATDAEQRALAEELAWSDRLSIALFAVSVLGALIIAALAGFAVYVMRRGARELVAAHAAVEAANRSLEAWVEERTADLKEANEEIQRFAYVVSHDLRAPRVNIMGFTGELEALRAELLMAEPEESDLRRDFNEALSYIKSSIAKMDR